MILDTNLLIDFERRRIDRTALFRDEVAIAAVTIAELRSGFELFRDGERAARSVRVLDDILARVEVLDYTGATAAEHGRLLAHTRRTGSPHGAHDLIIAAHAAQTGRILLSQDASARFGDLPGVLATTV